LVDGYSKNNYFCFVINYYYTFTGEYFFAEIIRKYNFRKGGVMKTVFFERLNKMALHNQKKLKILPNRKRLSLQILKNWDESRTVCL